MLVNHSQKFTPHGLNRKIYIAFLHNLQILLAHKMFATQYLQKYPQHWVLQSSVLLKSAAGFPVINFLYYLHVFVKTDIYIYACTG